MIGTYPKPILFSSHYYLMDHFNINFRVHLSVQVAALMDSLLEF
jgi:hypothetical protein